MPNKKQKSCFTPASASPKNTAILPSNNFVSPHDAIAIDAQAIIGKTEDDQEVPSSAFTKNANNDTEETRNSNDSLSTATVAAPVFDVPSDSLLFAGDDGNENQERDHSGADDIPSQEFSVNVDAIMEECLPRSIESAPAAAATTTTTNATLAGASASAACADHSESSNTADEDLFYLNGLDEDEDDFFAENKQDGELPEHMKDQFLEHFEYEREQESTLRDFEVAQFDVHGISTSLQNQEEPETLSKALHDLNVELEKLKRRRDRTAQTYLLAESQSSAFVQDRAFRLKFLRSVSYDVTKAAKKIMAFFDMKLVMWGEERLTKRITLADFDEQDYETIKNGHVQLLPVRDHSGRAVVFNNLNYTQYQDPMNQFRTLWYTLMMAIEDEETQKNGIVFIQYKIGPQKGICPNRRNIWKGALAQRAMPVKFGGLHVCFNKQILPFVRLVKYALEYHTSHRVKVHEGTQEDILYKLTTFGIPRFAMPVSSTGEMTRKFHQDWIQKLRKQHLMEEEEEKKMKIDSSPSSSPPLSLAQKGRVILPSNMDVILGRGKRSRNHPGNLRYNQRLEEKLEDFNLADRKGKKNVSMSIIEMVTTDGGRFLKPFQDGTWEIVSPEKDNVVKTKIAHDFRTVRKRTTTTTTTTGTDEKKKDTSSLGKKRVPEPSLSSEFKTPLPSSSDDVVPILSQQEQPSFLALW